MGVSSDWQWMVLALKVVISMRRDISGNELSNTCRPERESVPSAWIVETM